MGHMRMGVVGGITVGVMMRQRASIGDSWGGRHMVGNGWSVSNQRGSMSNHRGSMGVDNGCGMMDSGGALVDDCVETVVVIGGVLNGTDRTIGFNQRVGALDNIAIAHLMLRLHITSVGVSNTVVVVVLGIRMVVQTLIMVSMAMSMASIGQSWARSVESRTTVQDTGGGNAQDSQAHQ